MNTRIRAEIERQMQETIVRNCEEDDWPDFYVHPKLAQDMADAAYAVFMSSVNGQAYAKSQEVD